jgi:hypothetical protein
MDSLGGAAEASLPSHGEKHLDLSEGHSGFPYGLYPNCVLDPIAKAGLIQGKREEGTMIFRQILSPKTGCASYLLG